MRYRIELAYNGTRFGGWQIQPNAPTIQQAVQIALSQICNQNVELLGCGRTDAGVHASQFFAHFDTDHTIPIDIAHRLNKMLSSDISVADILPVESDFHSRFNATYRKYQYHIAFDKNPFQSETAWWFNQSLNLYKMNECATMLIGTHSFGSFCKGETPNGNFNCTVFESRWEKTETEYIFSIAANRFLRSMVRAIVGTLVDVGLEKINALEFTSIFKAGNRSDAGHSAPPQGLFLTQVRYD